MSLPSGQNRQKNSLKECVIQHSKYSGHIVKNTTPTDCFSGDFTHWVRSKKFKINL